MKVEATKATEHRAVLRVTASSIVLNVRDPKIVAASRIAANHQSFGNIAEIVESWLIEFEKFMGCSWQRAETDSR